MPNIVDRFGQLVDDAIPKPELARQLLLLGYRAKDVQLPPRGSMRHRSPWTP